MVLRETLTVRAEEATVAPALHELLAFTALRYAGVDKVVNGCDAVLYIQRPTLAQQLPHVGFPKSKRACVIHVRQCIYSKVS